MKGNTKQNTEWFEEWFDSPYYHILYKNRDIKEAQNLIHNLIDFLKPSTDSLFLDVACGKGRHSLYLNKLGFKVDGFDLSKNSIEMAKENESERLRFYVNDIRKPLKISHYNYAFNLFTSFGYFENEKDNQLSINSISDSLKENGILVLDFMNSNKVINALSNELHEVKNINNTTFNIKRRLDDEYIIKDIEFCVNNIDYHYQEKVKAITLDDFKTYFKTSNLYIEAIFGDYQLNSFDIDNSDRLILIARKQ